METGLIVRIRTSCARGNLIKTYPKTHVANNLFVFCPYFLPFFFWFFFWNRRLILARNGIGNHHLMCGWWMISRQNSSTLSHFLCSFFFLFWHSHLAALVSRFINGNYIIAAWELQVPGQDQDLHPDECTHYSLYEWRFALTHDTTSNGKEQRTKRKKKKMKRKERKGQDRRHSLGCRKRIITRLIDGIEFNSSR